MEWYTVCHCEPKCCCARQKKFTKYHGWRDPDLVNKPQYRSIPNRMKRFLAELRGDLKNRVRVQEEENEPIESKFDTSPNISLTMEGEGGKKPSMFHFTESIMAERAGIKTAVDDSKRWKALAKLLNPQNGYSVLRCATCDYPYDPSKRRKPPHLYEPVVVPLAVESIGIEGRMSDRSSAALKDMPSYRTKVHRMKRRRSSTELYKGFVSVD